MNEKQKQTLTGKAGLFGAVGVLLAAGVAVGTALSPSPQGIEASLAGDPSLAYPYSGEGGHLYYDLDSGRYQFEVVGPDGRLHCYEVDIFGEIREDITFERRNR